MPMLDRDQGGRCFGPAGLAVCRIKNKFSFEPGDVLDGWAFHTHLHLPVHLSNSYFPLTPLLPVLLPFFSSIPRFPFHHFPPKPGVCFSSPV